MRVLVTGALGFVGRHAVRELRQAGHTPIMLDHDGGAADLLKVDITDKQAVDKAFSDVKPDACIHLAGMAFVPAAWEHPDTAFKVNVGGTLHILEACRHMVPKCRMLCISTGEVYGSTDHRWIQESDPKNPKSLYAVTKLSADLSTLLYAEKYGMHCMTVRPINHIGPGQSQRFVSSSFSQQLAAIASGRSKDAMSVGNLESERDFIDVRDVVRAYRLLIEKGTPGLAYNVAAGKPWKIQRILEILCEVAGVKPELKVDPDLYRPTDRAPLLSTDRICEETGWTPEIPIETTLKDIYDSMQEL